MYTDLVPTSKFISKGPLAQVQQVKIAMTKNNNEQNIAKEQVMIASKSQKLQK